MGADCWNMFHCTDTCSTSYLTLTGMRISVSWSLGQWNTCYVFMYNTVPLPTYTWIISQFRALWYVNTTSNYGNTVALIVTWAARSVDNVFNLITHCPALSPNSAFQRHYSAPEMYDCRTLLFLLTTLDTSPSHKQWQPLRYRLSIPLG